MNIKTKLLGKQLNPSSTMSKKLSGTLLGELEAQSIFTDSNNATCRLVGPQLHSRIIASIHSGERQSSHALSMSMGAAFNQAATEANCLVNPSRKMGSNNGAAQDGGSTDATLPGGVIPQGLAQLLEWQWDQGSQFLMEPTQHFDIAYLLSSLHRLRAENVCLEEHVNTLLQSRDHLLAVNARPTVPLSKQPPSNQNFSNMHVEPTNGSSRTINPSLVEDDMDNQIPHGVYPQTSSMRHSPAMLDINKS